MSYFSTNIQFKLNKGLSSKSTANIKETFRQLVKVALSPRYAKPYYWILNSVKSSINPTYHMINFL